MEKSRATARQVAYIEHLRKMQGKENLELPKDLDMKDASKMIASLMEIRPGDDRNQVVRVNEPRLGMAMKECYRHFRNYGRDLLGNDREWFKDNVIKTYLLFTEIALELQPNGKMEDRAQSDKPKETSSCDNYIM